jgi:hypothetical protein
VDAQYVAMGVPIRENGGKLPFFLLSGKSGQSDV